MWLSSAWTEVEEKQPTSVSPLAWSPFSSHSAPLVFMDWFYWPQTWRFYTDLLRLRVVRTFTLFLLWVTFSCKTLETLSVNQGEFRNTLAQAPTQFSHCEPVAYTQNLKNRKCNYELHFKMGNQVTFTKYKLSVMNKVEFLANFQLWDTL